MLTYAIPTDVMHQKAIGITIADPPTYGTVAEADGGKPSKTTFEHFKTLVDGSSLVWCTVSLSLSFSLSLSLSFSLVRARASFNQPICI